MNCRLCHRYHFEGRRFGTCSALGVPVDGRRQACCLWVAPFEPTPIRGLVDSHAAIPADL